MTDRPRIPVHIFNCGELDDEADFDEVDSETEAANNAFLMYQRRRRDAKQDRKADLKAQQQQ